MPSRRNFVASAALVFAAGCTSQGDDPATQSDTDTPTGNVEDPPSETGTDDPTTTEPSDDPPEGEAVQWTFELGGPLNDGPVLYDGTLYVTGGTNGNGTPPDGGYIEPTTSQNLYALGTDGSEQWQYAADAGVYDPIATDDGVYVVTGWSTGLSGRDQRVEFVAGGEQQWASAKKDRFLSILGTTGDRVFVGTGDDAIGTSGETLYALGADGSQQWSVESGDMHDGTVHDGTLIASPGGRTIVAYDITDGSEEWSRGDSPVGYDGPELFDGWFLVDQEEQDDDGNYPLLAVDAADGTEQWRYTSDEGDEGPFVCPGATVVDGTVYGVEYGGLVFALDAADGSELWTYPVDAETRNAPAVADGTVYVPAFDGTLHALDAETGEARWTKTVEGIARGVSANADGVVTWTHGKAVPGVYAYGADGSERWSFRHSGDLSRPVVDGTRAYVAVEGGYVVGLGE
ncbi:PQQ-binding-like beta-propeller repeat protein [Haloarchaeobius sp. DFWS5]|uniref:PQQ-binding-like beta-propeller repeat protein n=1 Tax=Haloarchaeobius sp. DFWS5 TaxID=3446114 RepID=UPI003EBD391D